MSNGKFSFENINGMRILRVKNQPVMSSGVWNDWYYDENELKEAYDRTDWNDAKSVNLFYDHEDTSAKNWIGTLDKSTLRLGKNTIYSDLLIANEEAQKALMMGAKFGISPKILGKGENGSVKQFSFENWSLVVDPACKATFLNSTKKLDGGIELMPKTYFILKQTGDVMDATNSDAQTAPSTPAMSRDDVKGIVEEALKDKAPETVEVIGKFENKDKKEEDDDEDEDDKSKKKLMQKMSKLGYLSSDFSDFMSSYLKENPDASLSEMSGAWQLSQTEKRVEKLVEQKLSALEKGSKVSLQSESGKEIPVVEEDVDVAMLHYLQTDFLNKPTQIVLELAMQPKRDLSGKRFFELATATSASSVRGTVFSAATYPLQPIQFLRTAINAAKERMMFAQAATQFTLPEGQYEIVVPYRTTYLTDSSWGTSSAEFAAGNEIDWTQINTADGKKITPTRYNYGIALTNHAIRTSALNEVQYMREELSYKYENATDSDIRDALLGTVSTGTPTEPTAASDTVRGAQIVFGQDATNASNSLDLGDILTTPMISNARRLLMARNMYFWSSNIWTLSSTKKNPWQPTPAEPFILYISAEQEEALLNETKFTNAAEYGSNEILLNGEIGKYIGVKVVSTTKVPSFASGDNLRIQAANAAQDTTGHLCGMVKAGVCAAQVYGLRPEIRVFDWPNADQVRMKLSMAYASSAIQNDGIVRIAVSDA